MEQQLLCPYSEPSHFKTMQERVKICRQTANADAMEIAAGGIRTGNQKSLRANAGLHRNFLVREEAAERIAQKGPFDQERCIGYQRRRITREEIQPLRREARG